MAINTTYVRLFRKKEGNYIVQWSDDNRATWNDVEHRKLFSTEGALMKLRALYPTATYTGMVNEE